jgi:ribosomal protein S18 acetylase RimI-like enzyme
MAEARIRTAGPADAAALDAALRRLADDLGDAYRADPDALAIAAFGGTPAFRAALAEADGETVGAALWSPVFSTIRGTAGIYVSDLWVASGRRGERLGQRLLRHAAADGAERWDAGFLRLAVYHDNTGARRFYQRLGFSDPGQERVLVLDRPAFDSLKDEG